MIYNLAHNENKLITFTIDGTTYQAMNGMTWGEWVNSEYNTGGFSILNSYVVKDNYMIQERNNFIKETYIIDSSKGYYISKDIM